jgi:anti-sigma regulatory factor (Ser/Thr protein kinase)
MQRSVRFSNRPTMEEGVVSAGESRLVLRNDFSELGRLAPFVEEYATSTDLPPKASFAIQVCLEEAVSNIVRHGKATGKATRIIVVLDRDQTEVWLRVEDDGGPFDPTLVPRPIPPKSLEDAPIGGLGVHLMREFSSQMHYERIAGKNRLQLTFSLPRYAADERRAHSL